MQEGQDMVHQERKETVELLEDQDQPEPRVIVDEDIQEPLVRDHAAVVMNRDSFSLFFISFSLRVIVPVE